MNNKVITDELKSESTTKDGHVITVDFSKCIAAGPCSVVAPEIFALRGSDGKAVIIDPDAATLDKIIDAARSCPVFAISIKNEKGEIIYP